MDAKNIDRYHRKKKIMNTPLTFIPLGKKKRVKCTLAFETKGYTCVIASGVKEWER